VLGLLLAAVLLAFVVLPQIWVRQTFARHGKERPDLPGTGGELARHLLDRFGLTDVAVEMAEGGDHYDPEQKAVRLLPHHHSGRSLAAAAVAAHEVSHAIQDARGERMLAVRQWLAQLALVTDRLAGIFFVAAPVLAIVIRSPIALVVLIGIGLCLLSVRVITSLLTLPVELDASFSKALPILKDGHYLSPSDMPAVRSVLRAAAFTYIAAALMSLVNLARWIRLLR